MRIVIVANGLPSASNAAKGAFVSARAVAYVRAGHQVLVLVPRTTDGSLLGTPFPLMQVDHFSEVLAIAADFGADVAACHSPDPLTLSGRAAELLSSHGVRTVVWVHGYEALYTALHGYQTPVKVLPSLVRDFIRLRRLRRILEQVYAVVFVSRWLWKAAERSTGARISMPVVIPNPVDTEHFALTSRPLGSVIRFVSVRSLRRQYGLDLAIKALAGTSRAHLTVVGNGPLLNWYRALAQRYRAPVEFLPATYKRNEMPGLYSRYDAYLAPSRTETQGVAMCEAMSCGLPVVAARVGGIPEFVEDGQSGILVRPGSPAALRRAIEKLISSPDQIVRMGLKARESVLQKCDERLIIEQELAVLGCR